MENSTALFRKDWGFWDALLISSSFFESTFIFPLSLKKLKVSDTFPPTTIPRWWFQSIFIFTPTWGRLSNLTNLFQTGWNHQQQFLQQTGEQTFRHENSSDASSFLMFELLPGTSLEVELCQYAQSMGVSWNGGFPQQLLVFLLKMTILGRFGGYHHFGKHPYSKVITPLR